LTISHLQCSLWPTPGGEIRSEPTLKTAQHAFTHVLGMFRQLTLCLIRNASSEQQIVWHMESAQIFAFGYLSLENKQKNVLNKL